MANHKSAAKQARQNEKRRLRNRWWRARLRTAIKNFRTAVDSGETDKAEGLLTQSDTSLQTRQGGRAGRLFLVPEGLAPPAPTA